MATVTGEIVDGELVNAVERATVQKWFVDRTGKFLISTVDGTDVPEGGIEVPFGPDQHADQIWDFDTETWGPSTYVKTTEENAWREAEMAGIQDQIYMIEDEDPAAVGTIDDWRSYRKALRVWAAGNADFPFGTRPVRPS